MHLGDVYAADCVHCKEKRKWIEKDGRAEKKQAAGELALPSFRGAKMCEFLVNN